MPFVNIHPAVVHKKGSRVAADKAEFRSYNIQVPAWATLDSARLTG